MGADDCWYLDKSTVLLVGFWIKSCKIGEVRVLKKSLGGLSRKKIAWFKAKGVNFSRGFL
jgi:hypothetical protein